MKTGTNNFRRVIDAIRHYDMAPHCLTEDKVISKIKAGEVVIKAPTPNRGQYLSSENGRYFIHDDLYIV